MPKDKHPTFTTSQRTKEIGVRKVLGASVPDILLLLSKNFLSLVLLSFIIAVPIAWYSMHQWLQNYAFHPNLSWWLFALPVALVLLISLLTIILQSWKAALMNPINSLRNE